MPACYRAHIIQTWQRLAQVAVVGRPSPVLRLFQQGHLMKLCSARVVMVLFAGMLTGALAVGCKAGTDPHVPSLMPQVTPLSNPLPVWSREILDPNEVPASHPPPNLRFDRITREDGLSSNTVRCILQDSLGFMWIGTQDGLNRYDGNSFTVYRYDPDDPFSLRDDFIESMYEDRSGVLWIGTQAGWLERYDRENDRFTHYQISAHRSGHIRDPGDDERRSHVS